MNKTQKVPAFQYNLEALIFDFPHSLKYPFYFKLQRKPKPLLSALLFIILIALATPILSIANLAIRRLAK